MANKVSRRVRVLKLTPSAVGFHTVERYLAKVHKALRNFVECNRNGKQAKIQLKLRLEMFKYAPENKLIKYNPTFATVMMVVQSRNQTSKVLKKLYHSLTSNVEAFIRMGSGWTVNRIIFLEIQLVKCKKYVGGSRVNTTDLPPEIQGKKAVLNVKGAPKDWCFHYAVAASLLDFPPEKHPERAYHYRTMVAELEKVCMPMTIDNIPKFERKNRVHVDVFEWNNTKKKAGLLYKSQGKSDPYAEFCYTRTIIILWEIWISCSVTKTKVYDTYVDTVMHTSPPNLEGNDMKNHVKTKAKRLIWCQYGERRYGFQC